MRWYEENEEPRHQKITRNVNRTLDYKERKGKDKRQGQEKKHVQEFFSERFEEIRFR